MPASPPTKRPGKMPSASSFGRQPGQKMDSPVKKRPGLLPAGSARPPAGSQTRPFRGPPARPSWISPRQPLPGGARRHRAAYADVPRPSSERRRVASLVAVPATATCPRAVTPLVQRWRCPATGLDLGGQSVRPHHLVLAADRARVEMRGGLHRASHGARPLRPALSAGLSQGLGAKGLQLFEDPLDLSPTKFRIIPPTMPTVLK